MSTEPHDRAFDAFAAVLERFFMTAESESLQALRAFDLTMSQARCLFSLRCAEAPLPISEVAESIGLSPAATGRLIDHLVNEELVARKESDADRRIKLVDLTSRGYEATEAHINAKVDKIRSLISTLNEEQCETLISALAPLSVTSQLANTTPEESTTHVN